MKRASLRFSLLLFLICSSLSLLSPTVLPAAEQATTKQTDKTTAQPTEKLKEASVYHVVICWLKDPDNQAQRQQLIDATKKFRDIPGIVSVEVGNMLASKRPIVDSSYDIGIVMTFADQETMNSYLANPLHQQATKEVLVPLTQKVVVYDFVKID